HIKNEPPMKNSGTVWGYQRCCGTDINDVVNLDTPSSAKEKDRPQWRSFLLWRGVQNEIYKSVDVVLCICKPWHTGLVGPEGDNPMHVNPELSCLPK
ncbi:MAG: hypothetical protein RLZZ52_273, partial [Actinomycetota bacterium]